MNCNTIGNYKIKSHANIFVQIICDTIEDTDIHEELNRLVSFHYKTSLDISEYSEVLTRSLKYIIRSNLYLTLILRFCQLQFILTQRK
jgi:hypothetical protein